MRDDQSRLQITKYVPKKTVENLREREREGIIQLTPVCHLEWWLLQTNRNPYWHHTQLFKSILFSLCESKDFNQPLLWSMISLTTERALLMVSQVFGGNYRITCHIKSEMSKQSSLRCDIVQCLIEVDHCISSCIHRGWQSAQSLLLLFFFIYLFRSTYPTFFISTNKKKRCQSFVSKQNLRSYTEKSIIIQSFDYI